MVTLLALRTLGESLHGYVSDVDEDEYWYDDDGYMYTDEEDGDGASSTRAETDLRRRQKVRDGRNLTPRENDDYGDEYRWQSRRRR